MRAKTFQRCVVASLLLAACSSDSDTSSVPTPAPTVTAADITVYSGYVAEVDTAVRTYQAAMADPAMTPSGCFTAYAQYDQRVRPAIENMIAFSDEMDGFITEHWGWDDMTCAARSLIDELDDHSHIACMWPSIGPSRAEAMRHASVMLTYTVHAAERCDEMAAGMAGMGWQWSPMMCL